MKIIVRRNGKTAIYAKEHDGRFAIIKPDVQQYYVDENITGVSRVTFIHKKGLDGKESIALPSVWSQVIPNGLSDFHPMNEPLERWMFQLNMERSKVGIAEGLKNWYSLFTGGTSENPMAARAFSDNAGTDSCHSWVLNTFADREPWKIKLAITGGSVLKIIGETRLMGQDCWVVEAVDPLDSNLRRYHPDTHPWLFFYPGVSGNLRINDAKGNWIAKEQRWALPFWQFAYKSVLPILGRGGKAIFPKRICRELRSDEFTPSPWWNSTHPQHALLSFFYDNPYPKFMV